MNKSELKEIIRECIYESYKDKYFVLPGSGNAIDSHKKALKTMLTKHGGNMSNTLQHTPLHHTINGDDGSVFSVKTIDDGNKIKSHIVYNK